MDVAARRLPGKGHHNVYRYAEISPTRDRGSPKGVRRYPGIFQPCFLERMVERPPDVPDGLTVLPSKDVPAMNEVFDSGWRRVNFHGPASDHRFSSFRRWCCQSSLEVFPVRLRRWRVFDERGGYAKEKPPKSIRQSFYGTGRYEFCELHHATIAQPPIGHWKVD